MNSKRIHEILKPEQVADVIEWLNMQRLYATVGNRGKNKDQRLIASVIDAQTDRLIADIKKEFGL